MTTRDTESSNPWARRLASLNAFSNFKRVHDFTTVMENLASESETRHWSTVSSESKKSSRHKGLNGHLGKWSVVWLGQPLCDLQKGSVSFAWWTIQWTHGVLLESLPLAIGPRLRDPSPFDRAELSTSDCSRF